jgi:predicted nucleic acid-binding protein
MGRKTLQWILAEDWEKSLLTGSNVVACDAGPIIAILNRRDRFHTICATAVRDLKFPLYTVWPVIIEAYYILDRYGGPADIVLHWLVARHLRLIDLRGPDIRRIRQLTKKYSSLPMDLADAALVAACERLQIRRVFTIDRRDFMVYRPQHISHFEIVP